MSTSALHAVTDDEYRLYGVSQALRRQQPRLPDQRLRRSDLHDSRARPPHAMWSTAASA